MAQQDPCCNYHYRDDNGNKRTCQCKTCIHSMEQMTEHGAVCCIKPKWHPEYETMWCIKQHCSGYFPINFKKEKPGNPISLKNVL
jgi:hypothetical protein